jgi:hypothetical protein
MPSRSRCVNAQRTGRADPVREGNDKYPHRWAGGDPVVQFIDPVEATMAAGDDGDLRVRHEACPVAGLEAVSLLAMSAGLGTSVLAGQSSAEQAQAVIDYHLDRLFPASWPALRRAPIDPERPPVGARGRAYPGAEAAAQVALGSPRDA